MSFQLPLGSPACGWEGELCPDDGKLDTAAIAGLVIAGVVAALSVGIGLGYYRKYRYVIPISLSVYTMKYSHSLVVH